MIKDLKIEKNIPIPAKRGGPKPLFMAMDIGDSIFLEGRTTAALAGILRNYHPFRFTARKEADGVRVWRIE